MRKISIRDLKAGLGSLGEGEAEPALHVGWLDVLEQEADGFKRRYVVMTESAIRTYKDTNMTKVHPSQN